jgi:DNA repair protein RecO (recombination protein O)
LALRRRASQIVAVHVGAPTQAMPLKESEAIVLRTYPLGEADRLVSFLCRAQGRMRGVAKGAKRMKNRFGPTLEPLTHVRMEYFEQETRELVRVNRCDLIESFLDVQQDYSRSLALSLIAEITESVLPEREASDASFRLLLLTAKRIRETGKTSLPLLYFALWTVRLAGWLPDLAKCTRCERSFERERGFASPTKTGMYCERCKGPGLRAISISSLALAREMLLKKPDQMSADDRTNGAEDLNAYLLDLIEHHIERKLTSRRMMESA